MHEAEARWFAESLATLLAAAAMIEGSPLAGEWIAARLHPRGRVAGAIGGVDAGAVLGPMQG